MTDRRPAAPPAPARGAGAGGAGAAGSPPPGRHAGETVAWAHALQALAALVAHDFRNALNSVAVNLEVVRGRSARGAEATAIAPFAATAMAQFETASAAAEAFLALSRPEPAAADVADVTSRMERLLAVRGDGTLRLAAPTGPAATSAPPDLVRALVARSVLSALAAGGTAACEITVGDGIFLRVHGSANVAPSLDPDIVALAAAFAVRTSTHGHALELRFPKLGSVTPDAPA